MSEQGATGYERRIGRYGPSLADRFLEAVGAQPGQTALDVGCGTGALTVRLAALLGAANVSAIDPAADDVAVCRNRAPGCDVRVAEAEALPYPGARFDLVLAQLVVAHLRDAHAGVGEMRRVARPGGVVRSGELTATTEYAGFDDLWEPMLVTDGTPGRFLATLPRDRTDAVRSRLFARLGEPRGPLELSARAWYVAGTPPA